MFQHIHRHERVQALPGHVPQMMKALVGRLKDAILHQAEFFHLITTHFFDGRGPSRSEGARSIRQNRSLLVRSLLMLTSLFGLRRTNDCAQHLHLSAANRAIFTASLICVTVQHSKTENHGILPEMSDFYCHPGRAGGSPFWDSRNRKWNTRAVTTLCWSMVETKGC